MKNHDQKRIEIAAADGFAPEEIETLKITLERALAAAGTNTTISVHCLSGIQGRPNPVKGDRIEVKTVRDEPDGDDSFEDALHCVEALLRH